jgi:preprotein translocase subunit SecG
LKQQKDMKKFLAILIVLAIAIIVVVIMMKPSKEDLKKRL